MDKSKLFARDLFLQTVSALREPILLLKQEEDGTFKPLIITKPLADMLECSIEEAYAFMSKNGYLTSTHQEDRIFVRRMLRRHVNEEGGSHLIIRKQTTKGKLLWCNVNYSFITDYDEPYVFCTYYNITKEIEYEQLLRDAYTNLCNNLYQSNESTLSLFRVNLSQDIIEDMQGVELYPTDSTQIAYSAVMSKRSEQVIFQDERERYIELFDPEELIVGFLKGTSQTSLTLYARRPDGQCRYVTVDANTTRHPMTKDIIAFLSVKEANTSKVKETLLDRILSRQFDMVAWLNENAYGVVIGNASSIENGSIFPETMTGDYPTYIHEQVEPKLHGTDKECEAMTKALKIDTIRKALSHTNPYKVNIAVNVDNETWFKRFDFYAVDPEARFIVVLKSDTTSIQRKQMRINHRLKDALKESQEASVAKTAFLSRMSHEIRTPMNAIIGLGALALREQEISPQIRDYLTKIDSSAKYLLSLINDILDMSRIESGRMTIKKEEFSFKEFLDLVQTMADGQCRDRGLSFSATLVGEVDEYYIGDSTKLRQVLINILGNAVKFTGPGGSISLKVERLSKTEEESVLSFLIKDTGIGIEAEFIPKIFEPFCQEDSSNTSRYGGSGLGLAITKNIVSLMNGSISVESEKNKGTEFLVTVSLRNVQHGRSVHDFSIDPGRMRVLVIDDDPTELRHAHVILEEIGISSVGVSDEKALELISMHHARCEDFDLILVDLRMPEKDGILAVKEIRGILGQEPVIFILTACNWTDEEETHAKEVGCDGFLVKPVQAKTVLEEFKQTTQQRSTCRKEQDNTSCDLSGSTILLVEDVAINAEIMKQLLGIMHISVEHAENGKLAVECFKNAPEGHYDAILMDVRMPVMDGLSATRAIRQIGTDEARDIPIIAMTANAFDEDVQHSLEAGMNAHLAKPVNPEQLQKTLAQLISRRRRKKAGG
ncbi:MAG: response regulator [Desulfovibrio sp.]|nr:response regulator [Desulfovibrio sp.]